MDAFKAGDSKSTAVAALRNCAAALAKHKTILPKGTLTEAIKAAPEGVLLESPSLDATDQEPLPASLGSKWVHLAGFAKHAGVADVRVKGADRGERDEEQKRSYLNTWATAASKKLQHARRLATKDSKQRIGAWAAPLDSVLRTYGAE